MAVRKNDDVKNRTQKKQNQSREKLQRVLCREELWNSSVCYCNAVLYLVLFCTVVSLVLYLVFQCIVVQLCGWQCGSVAVWQCGSVAGSGWGRKDELLFVAAAAVELSRHRFSNS